MKNKYQETFNEQKLKEDIRAYMDSAALTDVEKEQMWNRIQGAKKRKTGVSFKRASGFAAAALCFVLAVGFGVNAASGGKVSGFIKELFHIEPESVEILENRTPEMEIYAPLLLSCDEKRLVFANSRGLVIYDRSEDRMLAAVDLQKAGCNYFTASTLETKVIVEEDQIRVFNTKNGEVQGDCYLYRIPKKPDERGALQLEPVEVKAAEEALSAEWEEKMNPHYTDTFEQIDGFTMFRWQEMKEKSVQYSEKSVMWTSKNQENYISCLLIKNNALWLYTIDASTRKTETKKINIVLTEEEVKRSQAANRLPEFVYTGDDKVMKAVCDYLVEKKGGSCYRGEKDEYPVIPSPVIYDILEEDGVVKVFGDFWIYAYYRNGNTLETGSGGAMPACFYLKEENGGYTVLEVKEAGDGSQLLEDVKAFCAGHPEIYQKYLDWEAYRKAEEKVRKELIEQYVKDNHLDIKYYHDYGWDPVELFTEGE